MVAKSTTSSTASRTAKSVTADGASGGSQLLLDQYPGAAAAYSLRKLRSGYSGSAIRVRRSSDSAEQDIGFTAGGDLDESALTTFCGAGDGFVTTWYDQGTSSNNATQATAARQPQIVSSGTVITQGSKPAIRFLSGGTLLQSSRLLDANTWSIFSVFKNDDVIGNKTVFCQNNGSPSFGRTVPVQFFGDALQVFFNNGTSHVGMFSTAMTASRKLVSSMAYGDDYYLAVNGVAEEVISGQALAPLDTLFSIGALGNSGNPFVGNMQECIGYASDNSANQAGIESNVNSYWSVY